MSRWFRKKIFLASGFTFVNTFALLMLGFYLIAVVPTIFGPLPHTPVEVMPTDAADCIEVHQKQGKL